MRLAWITISRALRVAVPHVPKAALALLLVAEGDEERTDHVETDVGDVERDGVTGDLLGLVAGFFLALMTHLAEHGVNCPLPVKGRDGEALRELSGRPAAIITFLEGVWPRKPNAAHCAGVGEGLARMHLAGANFAIRRANALSVAGWRPSKDLSREATAGGRRATRDRSGVNQAGD